ncbi:MAG: CinA family protein [Kiritimatiellae bacterium]|jgi:PncC family amidohydrolase|nr:CinA family protein [Kiritimatiellia bacterium]
MCENLIQICMAKGLTLAVAESCTGGGFGKAVTAVAGSSAVFKGGVICYSDDIKQGLLGVSDDILNDEGAVSSACAEAMVKNVRKLFKSDLAVAITGIAGPDGASEDKPVGLVYICAATEEALLTKGLLFQGDRESVREQAIAAASEMLIKVI